MQELPNRKKPRANRYDYTSTGVYFVTICTQNHEEYFGKVINEKMMLSEIGTICDEELHIMLQKRPSVDMHEYIIMPNHVHLLLCIGEHEHKHHINCRDEACPLPNGEAVNIHEHSITNPNDHQPANITNQTL
jgi:hypothetical protein